MTAVVGSKALRLLARRKLAGRLRSQLRRLKRPSGIALAALGAGLFGLVVVGVLIRPGRDPLSDDPALILPLVRLGALFLAAFTVGSSITHRGLFLPREEIERLFSAPLSRADIVRYRLLTNAGRSLFAGVIFGLFLMRRMEQPLFAFFGLMLAMQTLPIVGQASAILAGALEKRSMRRLRSWPGGILRLACFALGMIVFVALAFGGRGDALELGDMTRFIAPTSLQAAVDHPVLRTLTLPFDPWARMITAPDGATFATWALVCSGLWLLLFEATARLPIDFRELSLETSANVAERIRRHRRVGGGASAASVSKLTLAWRLPWAFGRGPGGAMAWRKATGIVRKARGTLLVSVFVLAIVTLIVASIARGTGQAEAVGGAALITIAGTLYLSAGLRFDFREDLDRMEAIKAWPLSPARIFTATILPEVALISALVVAGIAVRAFATHQLEPWLLAVCAAVPPFVFAWIALDNAVFLLAPVRLVPGQEGAMQNAGRAVVLMMLRGLLFAVIGVLVGIGFAAGYWAASPFRGDAGPTLPLVVGTAGGWCALVAADLLLVRIGGALFRRFDVAKAPA